MSVSSTESSRASSQASNQHDSLSVSPANSSDSGSLENHTSPQGRIRGIAQENLQTTSEMRQRHNHNDNFYSPTQTQSFSVAPYRDPNPKAALLQKLSCFEEVLKREQSEQEEDSSCCDCFYVQPSYGWRVNDQGQAEFYKMGGGYFADTADYEQGVASKVISAIGGDIKSYPLALAYFLEQEAFKFNCDSNHEVVKTLLEHFVEKVAEKTPRLDELKELVVKKLGVCLFGIISVLENKVIDDLIEKVKGKVQSARQAPHFQEQVSVNSQKGFFGSHYQPVLFPSPRKKEESFKKESRVQDLSNDGSEVRAQKEPQQSSTSSQAQQRDNFATGNHPGPRQTIAISQAALRQMFTKNSSNLPTSFVTFQEYGGRMRLVVVLQNSNTPANQAKVEVLPENSDV